MKDKFDPDEMIAESFQMENYMIQRLHYKNKYSPVARDIDSQLSLYLSYYNKISVQLQFQIFLYSSFFARKVEIIYSDLMKGVEYNDK